MASVEQLRVLVKSWRESAKTMESNAYFKRVDCGENADQIYTQAEQLRICADELEAILNNEYELATVLPPTTRPAFVIEDDTHDH